MKNGDPTAIILASGLSLLTPSARGTLGSRGYKRSSLEMWSIEGHTQMPTVSVDRKSYVEL